MPCSVTEALGGHPPPAGARSSLCVACLPPSLPHSSRPLRGFLPRLPSCVFAPSSLLWPVLLLLGLSPRPHRGLWGRAGVTGGCLLWGFGSGERAVLA